MKIQIEFDLDDATLAKGHVSEAFLREHLADIMTRGLATHVDDYTTPFNEMRAENVISDALR
jgi:hypothetical protein